MKANRITNPQGKSKDLHNWELWALKKEFEASSAYMAWRTRADGKTPPNRKNVDTFLEEMGYKTEKLI